MFHRKCINILTASAIVLSLMRATSSHGTYEASLSQQLNQYCEWKQGQTGEHNSSQQRRGKAGPPGPPGNVDYERIGTMISEGKSKQDEKISLLQEKVDRLEEALRKLSVKSCDSVANSDAKIVNETGGVFDIYPGTLGRAMEVYCDQTTDGGGWIVFQRRLDGSEDFERSFVDYENGFGRKDGEFWLGLRNLHTLTKNGAELRVDISDWNGNTAYAKYSAFSIGDASSQYTLRVSGYSGTAGDSMFYHSGQRFYAKDRDNASGCSKKYKGGMWYKGCHYVNLNGLYIRGGTYSGAEGVEWYHWKGRHGYSLKTAEMMLRPLHG